MGENLVVASDPAKAQAFAEQTFKLRQQVEEKQNPKKDSGFLMSIIDYASNNLIKVLVTIITVLIASIYFCCFRAGSAPSPAKKANAGTKKANAPSPAKKANGNVNHDRIRS